MSKGYFSLVLHAHLPYIHHPDYEEFMEEKWLFEAISETYIPLLRVFETLDNDDIPYAVTMSITPPLMEMLDSDSLQQKYIRHLESLISLSAKEIEKTREENPKKNKMAKYYHDDFKDLLRVFRDEYDGRLLNGFKRFQDEGKLEIITCNATHGFLPLMDRYPNAVRAQVKTGRQTYAKHMGKDPKGIWLAECGYTAGLDKYLAEEDIRYFFVDSHGIWYADTPPRYGVYRPIVTESGVFAFGRDPESSEQVWSAEIGYPGDFRYREFYRDVGFDRELDYIREYLDSSGVRTNTGIKYYKVTGKGTALGRKDFYDIEEAMEAARSHGRDFAEKKAAQVAGLYDMFMGVEPIVVAPFDAELFGHWWFEGPAFIEHFFRALNDHDNIDPITPPDFIENKLRAVQIDTPGDSTWGANGYNEVWINGSNDWIYRHLDHLIEKMTELASDNAEETDEMRIRALNQAARELMLAQSSDWAFIMTTGTTVEYASNRTKQHVDRFLKLYEELVNNCLEKDDLEKIEWLDPIFPEIDYRVYLNR